MMLHSRPPVHPLSGQHTGARTAHFQGDTLVHLKHLSAPPHLSLCRPLGNCLAPISSCCGKIVDWSRDWFLLNLG